MRIWLAAIGRLKPGPLKALTETYLGRLAWPVTVRELELRRAAAGAELKRREGALLLSAVPAGAILVALDEGGQDLSSQALAARIGAWRDEGAADLAFLIGGADGLDPAVLARSRFALAFGRQTWPHLLVRAMLAEQLYRAQTILSGHPYHRE